MALIKQPLPMSAVGALAGSLQLPYSWQLEGGRKCIDQSGENAGGVDGRTFSLT